MNFQQLLFVEAEAKIDTPPATAIGAKAAPVMATKAAQPPLTGIGSKAAPRPGGIGSAAAGQPGMEGDSMFSKILPGGAAEQAGKLGEANKDCNPPDASCLRPERTGRENMLLSLAGRHCCIVSIIGIWSMCILKASSQKQISTNHSKPPSIFRRTILVHPASPAKEYGFTLTPTTMEP
ncbi:hypothetical protein PAMP_011749 [Pampus punctatissimus]